MRLLYVCADPGIPLDGHKGASVHVRQTIGALARLGYEVVVLAARPGRGWANGSCTVIEVPARRGRRPATGPERELDAIAGARELVRGIPAGLGPVDLIYERYSLWSLTGAVLQDRFAVPLALEVNAPLPDEAARYRQLAFDGPARAIERDLVKRADAVLCVSSVLARRARGLRGHGRGVHVLPNAVDCSRFRPASDRAESGVPDAGPRIVFVGSLKPWHGLPVLVRAFAELCRSRPAARLTLVGDGPERQALRRAVREAGIAGNVTFAGALPHERIPELLRGQDVAVAPYPALPDFYFSPLKVAEYLASGLAVVASRCGDLAQSLTHGKQALLVEPGDPQALSRALHELAADPALRRKLGGAAREFATRRLSLAATEHRLDELLCGLEVA